MKDGKVDRFIDKLIHSAAVLGDSRVFVKARARMGMTDVLNAARSMKTPHPVAYMNCIDYLCQAVHQLKDACNFCTQVQKEPLLSKHTKSNERHTSEGKRQRKEQKAVRPLQEKPHNQAQEFTRPVETEHTKMHQNVPQTLIDKRKQLNQYSRCGQNHQYWVKCPSAVLVVAFSPLSRKRDAGESGHKATQVPKSRRIEAAPKPYVKQVVDELSGSHPPDLDILMVDTDMND